MKSWLIVGTMVAAAVEPVVADNDLFRYALTQGGLFGVVLVLLWSYRKDSLGALAIERERVSVLTELVASTRETLAKSADAVSAQAKSIDGLARVVEGMNSRRKE